jgi:hypothetical protein
MSTTTSQAWNLRESGPQPRLTSRSLPDTTMMLAARARSVCRVLYQGRFVATGFLISEGVIVTSFHTFSRIQQRDGLPLSEIESHLIIEFPLIKTDDGGPFQCRIAETDPIKRFDAVLCLVDHGGKLDGEHKFGVMARDFASGQHPLMVMHHRRDSSVPEVSLGVADLLPVGSRAVHTAVVQPGSSGSPCLSESLNLLGLNTEFWPRYQVYGMVRADRLFSYLRHRRPSLLLMFDESSGVESHESDAGVQLLSQLPDEPDTSDIANPTPASLGHRRQRWLVHLVLAVPLLFVNPFTCVVNVIAIGTVATTAVVVSQPPLPGDPPAKADPPPALTPAPVPEHKIKAANPPESPLVDEDMSGTDTTADESGPKRRKPPELEPEPEPEPEPVLCRVLVDRNDGKLYPQSGCKSEHTAEIKGKMGPVGQDASGFIINVSPPWTVSTHHWTPVGNHCIQGVEAQPGEDMVVFFIQENSNATC